MLFLVMLALVGGAALGTDPECTSTVAANGQPGRCVYASSCPYTYYISHRCPSYGNDVKCCYNCHLGGCSYPPPPPVTTTTPAPTTTTTTTTTPGTTTAPTTTTTTIIPSTTTSIDPECADSQGSNGQYGQCAHVDSCPHGYYITGKCPDFGNDIKCCYNCHLGGCSLSAPTTTSAAPTTTSTTITPSTTTSSDQKCSDSQGANGQYGQCAHVDSCPHGYFISDKCPGYGDDIKCCYNCHLGGCSLSAPSTTTSTTVTTATTTHHHHGDTSGDYGNILVVDTTGASAQTASQDGLGYSGVAASHQMASTDHARLNYYRQQIFEAANAKNMDPAIIAAIISRETRAGAALAADGTGDHGNGFGLMQVDYRYHTPVGGPYSTEHIKQGTQILIDTINCVQQRHPSWTAEMALKGGISGYNAGCGNVQTYAGMDVDTTGDDYANDVVARAQWLKAHGF